MSFFLLFNLLRTSVQADSKVTVGPRENMVVENSSRNHPAIQPSARFQSRSEHVMSGTCLFLLSTEKGRKKKLKKKRTDSTIVYTIIVSISKKWQRHRRDGTSCRSASAQRAASYPILSYPPARDERMPVNAASEFVKELRT